MEALYFSNKKNGSLVSFVRGLVFRLGHRTRQPKQQRHQLFKLATGDDQFAFAPASSLSR